MLPWERLGAGRAPGGTEISLWRRGSDFVIRADGRELMTSRAHGSEEQLAAVNLAAAGPSPCVLVGGLGMGYTLRAVLDRLPPGGRVVCAELVAEVVEWNHGVLGDLAGRPLDDPRTRVELCDVAELIARSADSFDAVLLDVDNGPEAISYEANASLYGARGLGAARRALRPGGVLAIWSAGPAPSFVARFSRAGFAVKMHTARARGSGKGMRHAILVGRRLDPK